MRYTEYHAGKAVVRDKNLLAEAMEKLARYEDAEENDRLGQWIPCSERLPEPDEYILLSFSNYSGLVLGRYEEDDGGGTFYEGDSLAPLTQYDAFVNAWMPLPKPYREDRDDE